jgi:fucose 4-O-acetylase-like acetyltransferase
MEVEVILLRNKNIDILKGFLIYTVVLGHTIQVFDSNFDMNFLFKIIYSFHMPFFFLVSGYLAMGSILKNGCSFKHCITNKILYLVIPYISWYMIFYVFNSDAKVSILKHLSYLINNVDNGLWYLWILFLMYVVIWFSYAILKTRYYYLVALAIVLIPNSDFLGLKYLKWYLLFFFIGLMLSKYKETLLRFNSYKTNIFIPLFLIFLTLVYFFWTRNYNDDLGFYNKYLFQLFKLFISILGIYVVYIIVTKIKLFDKIFIQNIGRNSLGIYILNFPIVVILSSFLKSDNLIIILFISVLSLILAHFFSFYLSKIKYISILFGVKK